MRYTILSIFAAALLSLATNGSATARTDGLSMPGGEARSDGMARIADIIEPAPAVPTVRVAPVYMKYDGIKGDVSKSKKGDNKKGLKTSPQSGGEKGGQTPRRPG